MGADGELPYSVVRQIGDKLYEKRKGAALEVEQIVKNLAAAGNTRRVGQIIDRLVQDFAFSPQANYRKGGLLCLAATAVGLANNNQEFLQRIVPPVLNSFTGQHTPLGVQHNIANAAEVSAICACCRPGQPCPLLCMRSSLQHC